MKDLGISTAYGYAVSRGYTGTEEEFAELMASYAHVAEDARASAETASNAKDDAVSAKNTAVTSAQTASNKASEAAQSAQNASTSASTASTKASEASASASNAQTSASTASTKASEAASSATAANSAKTDAINAKNAAQTAQTASETARTAAEEAQTSAEQAAQEAHDTLDKKAEIDGYYEEMTVGDAEQLISSQYVSDSVPYLYRTTGGSADVGNREYMESIVGGTVAWNQLIDYSTAQTKTVNGVTFTYEGDGKVRLSGTATATADYMLNRVDYLDGHKYLICGNPISSVSAGHSAFLFSENFYNPVIKTVPKTDYFTARIRVTSGATVDDVVYQIMLFDLTQMFGSTIADYIYSLEQANAGAGVAWFKKLFPNDYYAYDAGTLKSVEGLSEHVTVGFNQWDEEWELGRYGESTGAKEADPNRIRSKNYIPVFPNTAYCFTFDASEMRVQMYDADKNFILYSYRARHLSGTVLTTPSNCHFITFSVGSASYPVTTYKNDICINLSWSGWRNGEYEPYQKHSYPLDDSLVLRGIPKLDSSNNLYWDGDIYEADGTVARKYGIVDLGTLTWLYDSNGFMNTGMLASSIKFPSSSAVLANIISTIPVNTAYGVYNGENGIGVHSNGNVMVRIDNMGTDASAFKTAMSGVYLVYELATPTTEEAEPYNEVQICDDFGTEEFVSTSIVPVGHNTEYPANLRDKLQHLPNLADADGYYMIKQVDKQMSLEHFRIPKAPAEDGTWVLKAVVSGGTPTYSWVKEETA